MKDKQFETNLSQAVVLMAFLAFAMVYGSVSDLSFSKMLYSGQESSFGQLFAAFGELPAFIALSGAGAMMFMRRDRVNSSWRGLVSAVSIVLFFGGLIISVREATDNVPQIPIWVAVFICAFVIFAGSFLMIYLSKKFHSRKVFRYALTIALIAFLTLLVVNVIKVPWGRVRMHLIFQTGNDDLFSPWWVFGNPMKDSLIAQGIDKWEFRSCPSGHAACAACMFLFVLFPTQKDSDVLSWLKFALAFGWSVLVSISRIQMGAHFITDVVLANVIFTVITLVVVYFINYRSRYFNAIWNCLCTKQNPLSLKRLFGKKSN